MGIGQYLYLSGRFITRGVKNSKILTSYPNWKNAEILGFKYIPSASCDTITFKNKLSTEEIEAVFKRLCNPSSSSERPMIEGLLNRESKELLERCCPDGESSSFALKLLDVTRRRGHSVDYVSKFLENSRNYREMNYSESVAVEKQRLTALNALEFKDYKKAKNITLDTFKYLPVKEKKDFINALVSMEFRNGTPKYVETLPDIQILKEIKNLSVKDMTADEYRTKAESLYCSILDNLMNQIPRGKRAIQNVPIQIRGGKFLDLKPPFSNTLSDIPTKTVCVEGCNIKIGHLPPDKNCFVHNLSENQLVRLEGLLLTDENAILCAGRVGAKGELKAGIRPGVIISPKTMRDLLIQSGGDESSGYGAAKNLFNIQNVFLNKENKANTYLPVLIRKRMGLGMEEYNARLKSLGDIRYIEDIAKKDKDLFNVINDIISKEQMYEAILRPQLEGIYLPEGYKISKTIAQFAQRYDIPVLYSNAVFL